MKRTTVEHLLSYFDRLADYLESRTAPEDSEKLRFAYEILLGEKLDPELPSKKAARMIVRRRIAAAFERLKEPTSQELEELKELENRTRKTISRSTIWTVAKEFVVALIPRRHGHGPRSLVKEGDFPKIIATVDGLASEHPEWKRKIIYAEAGKEFGAGWRTMQDTYLEAKKHGTKSG